MTKRRESREQAFTLLFEKTVTGDSMEDIIEMAKEARDVVIDPYCEKLTALTGFTSCPPGTCGTFRSPSWR